MQVPTIVFEITYVDKTGKPVEKATDAKYSSGPWTITAQADKFISEVIVTIPEKSE